MTIPSSLGRRAALAVPLSCVLTRKNEKTKKSEKKKKSYSLARGKREAKKEKNEGGKKNFSEEKIKKIRERRAHTHF